MTHAWYLLFSVIMIPTRQSFKFCLSWVWQLIELSEIFKYYLEHPAASLYSAEVVRKVPSPYIRWWGTSSPPISGGEESPLPLSQVVRKVFHITLSPYLRSAPSNQNLSAYLDTWQTFLADNRQFIEHFDFIRDLAVEDPGDSPVIMAKWVEIDSSFVVCGTSWRKIQCYALVRIGLGPSWTKQ